MRRLITYMVILLVVASVSGAENDGGTETPFTFGVGARDLALGTANFALANSSTAQYWNPAALARMEQITISGFHANLYDPGVTYQFFGLTLPTMDWGGFGLGVMRLGINDIERRDENNIVTGSFSDNRLALIMSYGKNISGYDIGTAVTIEQHTLDTYKATSTPGLQISISRVIDLGSANFEELALALNGRNLISQNFKMDLSEVAYPSSADFGMSLRLRPRTDWDHSVLMAASISKTDRVDPRMSFGLEYNIKDFLFLRGGLRQDKLSAGFGMQYRNFEFDYALVDRDLGSLHLFNISTSFGMPISLKKAARERKKEEEFNHRMNASLTSKNEDMIQKIMEDGQNQMNAGNLEEAFFNFDRALFLARNSSHDTTGIYILQSQTKTRLDRLKESIEYERLLDSAQANLGRGDYMASKYYAGQALSLAPESDTARAIILASEKEISRSSTLAEQINARLFRADSLLNFGQVGQALKVIEAVKQIAPDDNRIHMTERKIRLELWRQKASDAYAINDLQTAQTALDSALNIFPGHKWCLELRQEIAGKKQVNQTETSLPDRIETLGPEIKERVAESYKTAQKLFEKGDFNKALTYWETVEQLAPGYLSVRQYLVKAYKFKGIELYGQNRLQEAIDVWSKAALLDPDNEEIKDYIKRSEIEIRKLKELSYESDK